MPIVIPAPPAPPGPDPSPTTTTIDSRLREPLFRLSDPSAWPRGVECLIDFDGYLLNDRRVMDRIFIESIGGLTGPDLAAEAEKNPDRDGETPYDVTYGGRTLTLRGYVDAGTHDTMRALFSYVLDAFDGGSNPSRERRLWFRYLDWREHWVDTNAMIDYVYDAGSDTLGIAIDGSGLQPTSTAVKELIHRPPSSTGAIIQRFTHGDGEALVGFHVVSATTNLVIGAIMRRSSALTKLVARYQRSDDTLVISKVVSGVETTLASAASPAPTVGDAHYLRSRVEGSTVSCSLWSYSPPDVGGVPLAEVSHVLSGGDLTTFPASTTGMEWGLRWRPNSTSDRLELFDVAALNKGDAVAWCRKAAQVEGDEVQENDRFKRSFAVALRASDARFVSRKPTTIMTTPTGFALTFPDDGSGLTFPPDGSGLVFGGYLDDVVTNLGRSPASPIIRLHGPMSNPVLLNPDDEHGRTISVDGSIEPGDYYEFDTARHTVVNSSGASVYRNIGDGTSWMVLTPGANNIILGADRIVADPPLGVATATEATDVFALTAHGLVDDQPIVVFASPFLGEMLLVYVRDATTDDFKVSYTVGGAALDVGADGLVNVYDDLGYVEFIYRHSAR